MTRIIGLSGSLRRGSYNTALLRAAVAAAPEGVTIEHASIADFPLYNGDLEQEAFPAAVTALKDALRDADGLLLVTPEYNSSIPGVFKNAIDWMSRPPKDQAAVFAGKPVGLIGASPGRGGTRSSQAAWLSVFRTLGLVHWPGKVLYVAGAHEAFDDSGTLTDPTVQKLLQDYLTGFCAFVTAHRRGG